VTTKNITSKVAMIFISYGCVAQSVQFDLLKNTVIEPPQEEIIEPNWIVSWQGYSREVFAINTTKSIYFANYDDLLIEFHENQIIKIQNFLFENDLIAVKREHGNLYTYRQNNKRIAISTCQDWSDNIVGKNKVSTRIQQCVYKDSEFENKIFFNEKSEIIKLQFHIHPFATKLNIKLNIKT
tara:strand:- start:929 stop:1474 length:546 start_codon:yes stop_codon:yes gene_type:complete